METEGRKAELVQRLGEALKAEAQAYSSAFRESKRSVEDESEPREADATMGSRGHRLPEADSSNLSQGRSDADGSFQSVDSAPHDRLSDAPSVSAACC